MNSVAVLNWAVVAVSIFNTIILLWLGLTVLLNAERPRWGTWVVGGGLLLAGLFFTAHTAAIARDLLIIGRELEIWLRVIWTPFVGGPYLWYVAMAWYSGVLARRQHRIWLVIVSALGAIALALPLVVSPLPSYEEFRGQLSPAIPSIAGIPVALPVYPVYSTLCIILAITALRRPGASDRFMGDLARRRARPWLMATSIMLLVVSLVVGSAAAWVLVGISRGLVVLASYETLVTLHAIDLAVTSLIAVACVLMGQAIVSYEIFTGKTLPRGGLRRYWRNTVILAGGYGALLAWSLDLPVDPIYRLMLATVLMTLFYALLSWRSYAERDRSMQRLRPFIASQHLYEQLIGPVALPELDTAGPFRALCEEVLDARSAALVPLGPLAPLVDPLFYPEPAGSARPPAAAAGEPAGSTLSAALVELSGRFEPATMCVAIEPAQYGGAIWAVPLWSERGLIGALLIGPRRGDTIYTQEEIEVARAAAERLIDTRASAELAIRLMLLQRQRLAASHVADRRVRRVLHDDVLPQIHTAMIMLQSLPAGDRQRAAPHTPDITATLADAHRRIADLLHDLPTPGSDDLARLGLIEALRGVVLRELASAFDQVVWKIEPEAERCVRSLGPLAAEVVFYAAREAIRNAARHARGGDPGRALRLTIAAGWEQGGPATPGLALTIEDDGVGMASALPAAGGSGRGLALHSTMLAVVGGTLTTESRPGSYTRVRLTLPATSAGEGA